MPRLTIDEDFVRRWSRRYLESQTPLESELERSLFEEVGRQVNARGSFTKDELMSVGEWKSTRARSRLARNPPALVERITRTALASPDERIGVLLTLDGVGPPMASAILTVWQPDGYTVYDFRAVATLQRAGAFAGIRTYPSFGLYLETCRAIVSELQLGPEDRPYLRSLDRALWMYDRSRTRGEK